MFLQRFLVAVIAVILMVSAVAAQDHSDHSEHQQQQDLTAPTPAEQQLNDEDAIEYVCPMHSHIVRDEPGTCPICGMDLEPQVQVDEIVVQVSGQMQQNLGITTATVAETTLWRYLPTLATVEWNDNARWHSHTRASGWLEELFVRSEGTQVQVGDPLYSIYSKELVIAQQDFLQTLDTINGLSTQQKQRLIRDGRLRLELLGLTAEQVKTLEQTGEILYRVPVFAKHAGVVTALNVAEGMYVEPGVELMTVTGANNVWLIADVPERYADWMRPQAPVDVTLPAAGLNAYETEIDYIYPELDPVAKTQRVRIKLPQDVDAGSMHVGMQAQVELYGGPKRDVLAVPVSALIMTGTNNRVIVQTDDQTFEQRDVHVGLIVNDEAEIMHGLSAGERVVTSGQFLLDSEASLKGSRLQGSSGGGHAH
ncbi:efflux RND transporter periplasmic adaptor subunit [Pseudidiomarina sp. 1APR75-33.1]|uniref:efflux RND transporter periplasmic adaptor subunit n=1 Tax=Pseudidiomarina terrestris TaxID=2820060 RepID=UPI002650ED52|nr:efflux RND transporter periplasmic adaptor subunit [Pseudidiomarina sp. 1APR75-33.1]MDN7126363.1 efflux RND transporter periplasmic adaptor subunit [Pseudidiomarina sp. 1APR75-33.1]